VGIRPPEIFGKYQMLHRIATGGMAEIWLARSSSIGGFEKLLAIKRMQPRLSTNQAFVSMFIDEARMTVSLNHPNIVQIFDFGRVDDDYFMAMEFVEGLDLSTLAKKCRSLRRTFPIDCTCYILKGVFDGLAYAHTRKHRSGRDAGIVHRDISPQNVLVSFDGVIKVSDFGIAKARSELEQTDSGELFGKLSYVSPEQVRGEAVDSHTDIWAAGVVLHEVLTNERLFARSTDFDTMAAVEEFEVPAPSSKNKDVPRELDELVLHTLKRPISERLSTAREAAERLAAILNKHYPTMSQFRLAEVISALYDHHPPRLVPVEPESIEDTHNNRPADHTNPFGDETAAGILAVARRQGEQVRHDKAWTAETAAEQVPRADSHTTALDLDLQGRMEKTLAGSRAGMRPVARLKNKFMRDPNLWTLVDIGEAYEAGGEKKKALGAFKLAAGKFAQRGLLIQAATIYRHLIEVTPFDDLLREEIRRLRGLQGISDRELLRVVLNDDDPTADFSEFAGIFTHGSEPVDIFTESPILSSLNAEQFISLIPVLGMKRFNPGDAIIREGELGESFFMVGRGRVCVGVTNFAGEKISINVLSDGDCFGEHGFFTGEPRNASVDALEEVMVLEADKHILNRVIQEFPTVRESLRRFYKERIAESLLAKSQLFGGLSTKARKMFAERFTFETYMPGDLVIREGDLSDAFYAIKSGSVKVYTGPDEERIELATLTPGEVFGEIAALEGSKRTASVRAQEECELLRMEAGELNAMLSKNIEIRKAIEQKITERAEHKLKRIIDSTS
jgi:serine/threonine protein kinase/CRP-like cAMP-binding protein